MKIIDDTVLHSQKWTVLKEKRFLDDLGREHTWTYIERSNQRRAVFVMPITEVSGSLILIRQFRVPFGREVIEFPAGLVDDGERPEDTAVRELAEETGYEGRIEHVGPEISTSAGITTETITMVRMTVGEQPVAEQDLEGSERIEVLKIHPNERKAFLERMIEENALFDAKVYVYLMEQTGA